MKVIYEFHKGEDKVTIISDAPNVTKAATDVQEVLKILFPGVEIQITTTGVHEDKG